MIEAMTGGGFRKKGIISAQETLGERLGILV
jgi:hypothetical protein